MGIFRLFRTPFLIGQKSARNLYVSQLLRQLLYYDVIRKPQDIAWMHENIPQYF